MQNDDVMQKLTHFCISKGLSKWIVNIAQEHVFWVFVVFFIIVRKDLLKIKVGQTRIWTMTIRLRKN